MGAPLQLGALQLLVELENASARATSGQETSGREHKGGGRGRGEGGDRKKGKRRNKRHLDGLVVLAHVVATVRAPVHQQSILLGCQPVLARFALELSANANTHAHTHTQQPPQVNFAP